MELGRRPCESIPHSSGGRAPPAALCHGPSVDSALFRRVFFRAELYRAGGQRLSIVRPGLTFKAWHIACPMQDVKYFRLREGEKRKNNCSEN